MKKILLRLMEYGLKDVDTYTYNGSVWLIFTDTKQWVLELTSEKTLWYNYTFFKQLFCVATDDVTSQDKFITEWAEKNMIKPLYSTPGGHTNTKTINDVIDNGVRHTEDMVTNIFVEDAIQNGVRHTDYWGDKRTLSVEGTLENGVKETHHVDVMKFFDTKMEDTLENGVKKTRGVAMKTDWSIETTIENGIKESICYNEYKSVPVNHNGYLDTIIQDGIKETNYDTSQYSEDVEEVIQHGIKEIYEIDWDVPNDVIDEVIDEGVIETINWSDSIDGDLTLCVNNVIENGIKETHDDVYHHKGRIDGVIKNGVKETFFANSYDYIGPIFKEGKIQEVIEKGIKNPTD